MSRKTLTVRRAADRKVMADALVRLAQAYGAQVEREIDLPREIMLYVVGEQGLSVRISLDGDDPLPDQHHLGWYIAYGSDAQFDAATFGGSVNPFHTRKAHVEADGFEDLCAKVTRGLKLAASGEAFLAPASTEQPETSDAQLCA